MALRLPPTITLPDALVDRLIKLSTRKGAPAFMYARISMDRVGAGLGVVRQLEDQCELFERLGLALAGVYADNDISAYSGKKRPDYLQMLDDVAFRKGTAVTAWHTDRLHRSPVELEDYITVCEPAGSTTYTVKAGHLDLSTPAGRMVARQLGAVARFESEHKADRIRAARFQAAKDGRWKGGLRPFGFERDGETVRYEEAAEIIMGSETVLAGGSVRSLVMDLNARGVTTTSSRSCSLPGCRSLTRETCSSRKAVSTRSTLSRCTTRRTCCGSGSTTYRQCSPTERSRRPSCEPARVRPVGTEGMKQGVLDAAAS